MPPKPASPSPNNQPLPVGWPRSLRGVPGGYDPQRLPIAVRPYPDETPGSWARRIAARYQLPIGELLNSVGIRAATGSLPGFAASLTQQQAALRSALSMPGAGELFPPGETTAALQTCLDRYLETYQPGHRGGPGGSRFCPACLDEHDGAWHQAWRHPLVVVCLEHRLRLLSRCPQCRTAPWSQHGWLAGTDPPWHCARSVPERGGGRRRSARRCGLDLRIAPASPAGHTDIAAQQLINSVSLRAGRGNARTISLFGDEFTGFEVFCALLELADATIVAAAKMRWLHAGPATVLAALHPAMAVLSAPDLSTAYQRAQGLLSPTGRHVPVHAGPSLRRRAHNQLLAHIVLTAAAPRMTPPAQLTFRAGGSRPRYPAPDPGWSSRTDPSALISPSPPETPPLSWIPQLLWNESLPGTGNGDPLHRAVAALLLARLGSTRNWQHIAIALGLPATYRNRTAARIRQLRAHGQWEQRLAELDDLFDRLALLPPPIDYQERREVCADGHRLLRATTQALTEAGTPWYVRLSALDWARLFWRVYTGGDTRLAPAPLTRSLAAAPDKAISVEALPAATVTTLTHIRTVLRAKTLVTDTGPLTWSPTAQPRAQPMPRDLPTQATPEPGVVDEHMAIEAVLGSCDANLTPHQVRPWFAAYYRHRYGLEFEGAQHPFALLGHARNVALGATSLDYDPLPLPRGLDVLVDHTLRLPTGGQADWIASLHQSRLG
jgi:hypothetical protein